MRMNRRRKASWTGDGYNPYEDLPKLTMLTYQMSPMIMEKITQGADMSEEGKTDYAFDLNEFFAVNESGQFVHKEEVRKFLVQLRTGAKYPSRRQSFGKSSRIRCGT